MSFKLLLLFQHGCIFEVDVVSFHVVAKFIIVNRAIFLTSSFEVDLV
jgi:hypothetical protein